MALDRVRIRLVEPMSLLYNAERSEYDNAGAAPGYYIVQFKYSKNEVYLSSKVRHLAT